MTNRFISLERFLHIVLMAAVLLGIGWLLHTLSAVLMPFFVALVIAYLLDPMVARIRRVVKYQWIAVLSTLLLMAAAAAGLLWLIIPQVTYEAQHFATLMLDEFPRWQEQAQQTPWMRDLLADIDAIDPQQYLTEENLAQAVRNALPGFWLGLSSVFGGLFALVAVFTTLIYLIFMLIDEDDVKDNWEKLIPPSYRQTMSGVIADLQRVMNLWFRGQLKLALVLTLVYIAGFWIIGLPLALVLGLVAGALSIIPYLSLLTVPIALFSAGLLSMDQHRSLLPVILLVLLVYSIAYVLDGLLLTPRIQGKNTGLRPQYILLALSVWGYLFGVVGMIIALPLTTVIISFYRRSMLGEEAPGAGDSPAQP